MLVTMRDPSPVTHVIVGNSFEHDHFGSALADRSDCPHIELDPDCMTDGGRDFVGLHKDSAVETL